jgi:hypothetical protein
MSNHSLLFFQSTGALSPKMPLHGRAVGCEVFRQASREKKHGKEKVLPKIVCKFVDVTNNAGTACPTQDGTQGHTQSP